jgi:hypothetical protein
MKFHIRLEIGDGTVPPGDDVVGDINRVLHELGDAFRIAVSGCHRKAPRPPGPPVPAGTRS